MDNRTRGRRPWGPSKVVVVVLITGAALLTAGSLLALAGMPTEQQMSFLPVVARAPKPTPTLALCRVLREGRWRGDGVEFVLPPVGEHAVGTFDQEICGRQVSWVLDLIVHDHWALHDCQIAGDHHRQDGEDFEELYVGAMIVSETEVQGNWVYLRRDVHGHTACRVEKTWIGRWVGTSGSEQPAESSTLGVETVARR
jgi:hypothetical protein